MQPESRVRSVPLAHGREQKSSAIITRRQLDLARGPIERGSAWMLLLLSILGTVVSLHGGWEPVLTFKLSLSAVVGGVLLQIGLTALEWMYGSQRRHLVYLAALTADTALTAVGYAPILMPSLLRMFAESAAPMLFAHALIAAFAVALAAYPESRMVE